MSFNSSTNNTATSPAYGYQKKELNLYYAVAEVLVAIFAVIGNALVILVFRKERRLRRRTNYYIISLAVADFLVGLLGIPFAIMSSVGLPTNLHACLFTVSLLVVLCTISIFCLVAVSVDRYWAILHPMGYSRNVRTKTALVIISICWFSGSVVGFLPLMGWHKGAPNDSSCFFLTVMDYNYLVFLYFGTIITPALILAAFYAHIYRVVLKQLRHIVTMNPEKGTSTKGISSGGMIRMLGVQQTNEVKATQNLAIIVLFFMICWIPLYTINCIIAFYDKFEVNSTFMLFCIILSHLNSAGNPLLYAYHLKDFRAAMKNFFCDLFHMERPVCDQFPPRYTSNNFSQYRMQNMLKKTNSAQSEIKNKLITPTKVKEIVNNTAVVAAAMTGRVDSELWNIAEDSGRDSASSSHDSLKSVDSCNHENILMIRPATPYRPRIYSEINQAYVDNCSIDETDDVFLDHIVPSVRRPNGSASKMVISSSSPQISLRGLFFIEAESNKHKSKSYNCNLVQETNNSVCFSSRDTRHTTTGQHVSATTTEKPSKAGNTFRFSPYKVVSNLFKDKRKLNRSLSEGEKYEDRVNKNGVIVKDYCSGT